MQPYIHIIRNTQYPNIIDIEMQHFGALKEYDAIECHIVAYPYHREISADDIGIHPFEEYVEDILDKHKSAYTAIAKNGNKRMGLTLALIVGFVGFFFRKDAFISAEVIASIIGAYIAGKELWADLENYLLRGSNERKVRYFDGYYSYTIEKNTTLTQYAAFAKRQRYQKENLLATKMDFIEQSNSKTVRLYYEQSELKKVGEVAHIVSIHIQPEVLSKWESAGYLIGVKLSLNRKKWGIWHNKELFQSLSPDSMGCLDKASVWQKDAVAYRHVKVWGSLKYFQNDGILANEKLIVVS